MYIIITHMESSRGELLNSEALSVVIPARNASKTIRQSVNSALMQMQDEDELIVLDDNSEDNTLDVLTDMRDSRLRIVSSEEQLGVSRGANLLIHEARNDLIARLDSDDLAISGRIQYQREKMTQDTGLAVTFTSQVSFGYRLRYFFPVHFNGIESLRFPWELLTGNPVCHSSSMMRKSKILSIGGYREVAAEDYDLWIRCALNGLTLQKFRRPGVLYRKHESQLTRQSSWRNDLISLNGVAANHQILASHLGWTGGETWHILNQLDLTPIDAATKLEFFAFVKSGKAGLINAR